MLHRGRTQDVPPSVAAALPRAAADTVLTERADGPAWDRERRELREGLLLQDGVCVGGMSRGGGGDEFGGLGK